MKNSVMIRSANPEDSGFFAKIMRSNIPLYDPIMPGAFEKYAAFIEVQGIPKTYFSEIIEFNNLPVGIIGTIKLTEKICYLLAFYLFRDVQGKGIGKTALRTLTHRLKKDGFTHMILLAHKEADWARQFYEKNGFVCISEESAEIEAYKEGILKNQMIKNCALYEYMF